MSAIRPWQAYCAHRFVGSFMTLDEARAACKAVSDHKAVRASARNTIAGERWFRGRDGWFRTADEAARDPVTPPMPHEVDR